MLNLAKLIKPWKEADALNAHVSLYGFWDTTTFLTKRGDLGLVLSVPGMDYESLDSDQQAYAVRRIESAMKSFGQGFHIYQYLFKQNRPHVPFAKYEDGLVDAFVEQRRRFFEEKRDQLYEIQIVFVILIEGKNANSGVISRMWKFLQDPNGGYRQLKALFASNQMTSLLYTQIEADRLKLEQRTHQFIAQMHDLTAIRILNHDEQFAFFRRLLNFDDWRINGHPTSTQYLDYQVVNSDIEAERNHIKVGDHFLRVLTMKESVAETHPLILDPILKLKANFYVVLEWTPLSLAAARREVEKRRKHFNMTKTGFISQVRDPSKTREKDILIDEAKQADVENLGDCLRILGEGQGLGELSLTIVLYDKDLNTLEREVTAFAGVFTNLDGVLHSETYNQLNAFFATIPGNYIQNLRRHLFLSSNYADLSLLFTIDPGDKTNTQLASEYLAVMETAHSTPYYLNLHNGEVAHTLILGMTGSGKSFLCNFLLASMQKYKPDTYIFDIGGSFESLTETFGGFYMNVGQENRDFKINPFSLPETENNKQFLYKFFKVLIEGVDRVYRLEFKEERRLYEAIERMYVIPSSQRTISTFAQIIGELKERLHRWTSDGQYGFLFDNVEDTLSFTHFQAFNFKGWDETPEVLEPLLFYILHRSSIQITSHSSLNTFKAFLIDEAWLFVRNQTIRDYIIQAQKTWRKNNAAMILATQSLKELEESGMLEIVVESCPTKIFLANPAMDSDVYKNAFHLNDTELEIIANLVPPGEMLIQKQNSSKKVRLNVDSVSYWLATNNVRDNLRKREAFQQYGIVEGIKHLASLYPHKSRQ